MIDFRKLPLAFGFPAALLLGAAAYVGTPDLQDARDDGPRLAVVNLDELLKSYPGALARQEEWKAMEAASRKFIDALRSEVENLQTERLTFEEDTEDRARANMRFELKRREFEEEVKIFEVKANRARLDASVELYDELRQGIAQFAKIKGIEVVMRARADARANTPRELVAETNQTREVLYFAPQVDITEDVSRFLKQWKPEQGK